MSEEFRKELEKIAEKFKNDVEALIERVEELRSRGEHYRAYRVWIEGVVNVLKKVRDSLETLGSKVKELGVPESEVRASLEYFEKEVKELLAKVSRETSRFRERRVQEFARYVLLPERIVKNVAVSIGRSVEDVVEGISRVLEAFQQGLEGTSGRTSHVVSVRVRDRDLEVVDQLVDAGIFKSRSDAISYFARKGIEASRDWIEKALEQAKKIRELQESIRRELGEEELDQA